MASKVEPPDQHSPSPRDETGSLADGDDATFAYEGAGPAGESAAWDLGQTIGPYRLVKRLGQGGMGSVWLAEQTHPVRRKVALKLIKPGMDTEEVVARFSSERQALAMMEHPAIARVYDAGSTPEGRPYFAMEYVEGVPITDYCDAHHLAIRQRVELFMLVCDGVQHAHQKSILHRDLKPSNVLVTEQDAKPVPKIIDFGLAKAMASSAEEFTMRTRVGVIVGTPRYMSPEQTDYSGADVDTRTDVYSLGIILYELLVGMPPFHEELPFERVAAQGSRRRSRASQQAGEASLRQIWIGSRSRRSRKIASAATARRPNWHPIWADTCAVNRWKLRRHPEPIAPANSRGSIGPA